MYCCLLYTSFLYVLMHEPEFIKGRFDTGYVDTFVQELKDNGTIV